MARYLLPLLFLAGLFGAATYVKDRRASIAQAAPAAPQAAQAFAPATDREQWAVDFLAALGNAQPAPDTIAMVVEWTLAEDAGSGAFDRNNPLNTTQPGFAETATINGDGVKGYADRQSGLDAAVHTVTNGMYGDVVAALLANDAEGARRALWASPWAGSHYGYGASWPRYAISAENAPAPDPMSAAAQSNPISLAGDCGYNIQVAIEANGGALQHIQLAPGETFSFNATMGTPAAIPYVMCAGVPGGNWCNLAARYAQVARFLGLAPQFEDHGVGDLGGGPENSVAIWNVGGQAGSAGESQDLEITNTTDHTITFQTRVDGDRVVVEGG